MNNLKDFAYNTKDNIKTSINSFSNKISPEFVKDIAENISKNSSNIKDNIKDNIKIDDDIIEKTNYFDWWQISKYIIIFLIIVILGVSIYLFITKKDTKYFINDDDDVNDDNDNDDNDDYDDYYRDNSEQTEYENEGNNSLS